MIDRLAPVAASRIETVPPEVIWPAEGTGRQRPVDLVEQVTILRSRAEVEQRLPDILGRALAFCWVDRAFRARFLGDPRGALAEHGVLLPASILIESETGPDSRPRVVVYEERRFPRRRVRVMHLQIVMLAGR